MRNHAHPSPRDVLMSVIVGHLRDRIHLGLGFGIVVMRIEVRVTGSEFTVPSLGALPQPRPGPNDLKLEYRTEKGRKGRKSL